MTTDAPQQRPDRSAEHTDEYVKLWRTVLTGKSWVLFRHGTVVVPPKTSVDLRTDALAVLRQSGPVRAGSPSGDFSTIELSEGRGWLVSSHHPAIYTYVAPSEMPQGNAEALDVGLYGRSKRARDASELEVIHIEDPRKEPTSPPSTPQQHT